MKKKIISFITSATMTLTCLGGGLSEITCRLNLTSEPIVAKVSKA